MFQQISFCIAVKVWWDI